MSKAIDWDFQRYFVWERENNNVVLWDTIEEAKKDAERTLEYYCDEAENYGRSEDEETCVILGKIMETPRRVNHWTKEQYEKDGKEWPYSDLDEVYDLQLAPVPDSEEDV